MSDKLSYSVSGKGYGEFDEACADAKRWFAENGSGDVGKATWAVRVTVAAPLFNQSLLPGVVDGVSHGAQRKRGREGKLRAMKQADAD